MKDRAMTENEAKYCLKAQSELHPEICENCQIYGETGNDHCSDDAREVAIKALEELQQYRVGTLKELQRYQAIGTPEECRAATEKQKPMAVVEKTILSSVGEKVGKCPECLGEYLKEYDNPYCPECGQRLDWRANEE